METIDRNRLVGELIEDLVAFGDIPDALKRVSIQAKEDNGDRWLAIVAIAGVSVRAALEEYGRRIEPHVFRVCAISVVGAIVRTLAAAVERGDSYEDLSRLENICHLAQLAIDASRCQDSDELAVLPDGFTIQQRQALLN